MTTSKNTLKNWFKTSLKPPQEQFWAWLDSYRHNDDAIEIESINGLNAVLASKQDIGTSEVIDINSIDVFDPNKFDGYKANINFVSYKNLESPTIAFHTASIYLCILDASTGQSPESHPEKWEDQGDTIEVSSDTCNWIVGLWSQVVLITGQRNGHKVGCLQNNAIYNYNSSSGQWEYFSELKIVVVQVTGTSTTAVMSQKAVTDAIAAASGGGSGLASTWEANIAAIRALSSHNAGNDVGDYATLNIYEYDALSTAVDDGDIYLKPNDVSGAGRWVKKKQLALKSEVPVFKEYQISTIGATTGLLSISQLEKIVAIPSKYNIDSMKITPISGGADIILINTGGVIAFLPINLAAITYLVTIVYASGASNSSTILQTQKQ